MSLFNKLFKILLIISAIFIVSCSAKNLLTMSVTEPAPVTIQSNVKKVGIINRSLPTEENKTLDNIEKILSAEGKELDKLGSDEAIKGLFDELKSNDRFAELKIIADDNIKSTGAGIFPAALSSETIDNICNANDIDALFVLSFFDTDTRVDIKAVPIEIDGPLGVKIPAIESHANVNTLVKTGWRIYDKINKHIADEFIMNDNVFLSGKGINPMKAAQAIIGRKQAVLDLSNKLGHNYGLRILPYRIRVSRYYYVRGTEKFKIAKRRAQTGDWNGAAELWEQEINNPKRKVAGRAHYNMAIINEINGNLETAVDWASKSYTDYKNKLALDYLNILKYRIQRNEELKQQQSE